MKTYQYTRGRKAEPVVAVACVEQDKLEAAVAVVTMTRRVGEERTTRTQDETRRVRNESEGK